jgi:hypothetical protein
VNPRAGTEFVIALSLVLVLWYFAGAWGNRALSRRVLRWLQAGWPGAGSGHVRRLGPGHVQVAWDRPPEPWRRLACAVVLEPREALLVWGVRRLRGERDRLVLRGDLVEPPPADVEVPAVRSPGPRGRAAHGQRTLRGRAGSETIGTPPGPGVRHLSVRRQTPHVTCEVDLAEAMRSSAGELLRTLATAVHAAARGGMPDSSRNGVVRPDVRKHLVGKGGRVHP